MSSKITIVSLMAFVAYIAVGLAAIRTNNAYWAFAVLGLTIAVLGTATLVAIRRRGASAGFAVFGWAWLVVCQPNQPVDDVTSLTRMISWEMVPYLQFKLWSLSATLSLTCIAFGLLGAAIEWAINRRGESSANHNER